MSVSLGISKEEENARLPPVACIFEFGEEGGSGQEEKKLTGSPKKKKKAGIAGPKETAP